jgi:hypothetical protein
MSRQEVDLERALADLGAHLEYPATPDLAAAVAARLREAPATRPGEAPARPGGRPAAPERPARSRLAGLLRLPGWRRLGLAGLAVALLAAAVLVASPSTREAVARRLGLRGVEIRLGGERPTPTVTTRAGERLDLGLGQRVTLDEARRRVGFPLLVPTAAGFEQPDAVFVSQQPGGGQVHFVYRARPGLPASPYTDAGLLVTQFRATLTQDFVKKLTNSGVLEEVTVAGQPGYWFSGDPHFFTYRRADGQFADEGTRLAGNALVWQRGEQTLRLEGQLSKEEALRIAESMR